MKVTKMFDRYGNEINCIKNVENQYTGILNFKGKFAAECGLKNGEIKEKKVTKGPKKNGGTPKKTESKNQTLKEAPGIPMDATIDKTGVSSSNTICNRPNLHIDLQIHIYPDSTPEQIECIFASMAKHLYGRDDK